MQRFKISQYVEYLITTGHPIFDLAGLHSSAKQFNYFVTLVTVPFIRTCSAFFAMHPPVNAAPATPSV